MFGVSFTTTASGRVAINGELFNNYNVANGRGAAQNSNLESININTLMSDTFASGNGTVFGTGTTFGGLSTSYSTVLKSAMYNPSTANAGTFSSLTEGQEYQVQLWVNDSRNNAASTGVLELDGAGTLGAGVAVDLNTSNDASNFSSGYVANGIGQWITGTFVADATGTQTFRIDGYRVNNSGVMVATTGANQLQGMQLRAIPEPATLGLVAAFGGGIMFIRRRQGSVCGLVDLVWFERGQCLCKRRHRTRRVRQPDGICAGRKPG